MLPDSFVFWIHTLYELSGILLGIGLVITGLQLRLLKKDMLTRSRRSAAEHSIAYLEMYSDKILNTNGNSNKVVGDVAYKKFLESKKKDSSLNIDGSCFFEVHYQNHKFDYPLDDVRSDEFQDAFWRVDSGIVTVLNHLEIFSVAMIEGVADEKIAFAPTSKHFCRFVKENYLGICKIRQQVPYENVVKLFELWNSRLEKIKAEKERERHQAAAIEHDRTVQVLSAQARGREPL